VVVSRVFAMATMFSRWIWYSRDLLIQSRTLKHVIIDLCLEPESRLRNVDLLGVYLVGLT
jgi:hypothetical protein